MAMDKKTQLLVIPLIIAIIVIIGLIAGIVYMNSEMEKLWEDMDQAARDAEREKDLRANLELEKQKLTRFVTGSGDADPSVLKQQYLIRRAVNEHLDKFLGEESPRSEFAYLTELYNSVFTERERALVKALTYRREAEASQDQAKSIASTISRIKEEKDKEITRLVNEKRDLETQKSNMEQQYKAELARKEAQIEQERTEKLDLEKKLNMEIAALRSDISEKKRRIDQLVKKKAKELMSADPDGEVILADNKLGYCWVNLGRTHGLRAGSTFEVFRYIKGGRRKMKGKIEIKKIDTTHSQAAIIESLDPEDDPIVKGDYIISPLFDREETKIFVFAGELINPLYSKAEVVKMIEEMGAKVDRELSVETDFLIAGKGAEETEEYTKAVELGIFIMREDELFKYIGK